jgi:hypothetical protein
MRSAFLLALVLSLAVPVFPKDKVTLIIKDIHKSGGNGLVQPIYPVWMWVEGDLVGLTKGQSLVCEILDHDKEAIKSSQATVERWDLKCPGDRMLKLRKIFFTDPRT